MSAREQLLARFEALAADRPHDLAVAGDAHTASFADLMARVAAHRARMGSLLGTEPAVVGHAVPNGPDAVAIELAAWAEGHASLALPRRATTREAKEMLEVVVPELIVVDSEGSPWASLGAAATRVHVLEGDRTFGAERPPTRNALPESDILQLQFSSGSSGRPKAICMEGTAVLAALRAKRAWYDGFPQSPAFSVLPQNHAMGRASVIEALWSGRGVVLSEKTTPGEHQARMRAAGCGTLFCNPTYARLSLALGLLNDAGPLGRIVIGTASVEPALVAELQAKEPSLAVDIRYGVSEAFGALTVREIAPGADIPATGEVGLPLPGVEIDGPGDAPGPIRARAPSAALAQVGEGGIAELRDADGYIKTGDLGRVEEDGRLRLAGRANISISHRGHRVDPIEIESVVKETGAILEAVAIGVPDPLSGERIAIAVVPAKRDSLDSLAIKDHCQRELSAHKVPHWVMELPEIPTKASGKPDRQATRERVLGLLGQRK